MVSIDADESHFRDNVREVFNFKYSPVTILSLANNQDNTEAIDENNGEIRTVTLEGRTLTADWNTLCLPFSLDKLEGTQLERFEVKELDTEQEYNGHKTGFEDGTLYLNFKPATSIEAGKPYIVKMNKETTSDGDFDHIVDPTFGKVTIDGITPTTVTSEDGAVSFMGIYNPIAIGEHGDNTKLYLGSKNKLYYPIYTMNINAFRAYFQLNNGIVAGEPEGPIEGIKAFVMNLDDATGIKVV